MIFRNQSGKIYSNTISDGIASFSVKLKKASATAGDRQVELFINSISKGTSTAFDDTNTHTFEVADINIEGNIVIEIKNIQGVHVAIDDITWTGYTAPVEPEEITECNTVGDNSDLSIEIDDVTVEGFGDDEEWLPLDEIEIEIKVENENNDYDIDDIEVVWGLYDSGSDSWYIDEEESDFNLKDGDDKTIIVTFKLDDDVDELEDGDWTLYVWANAVLDDDSDDGKELCASDSVDISMEIENDFVILDDIVFPEIVSCGSEFQVTADIWNIGDDDQEDVYLRIYNKELGINERVVIGDVDAFEDERLDILIKMPEDAEEKYYPLTFWVFDEDGEVYENDYDEDEAEFILPIKVEGSCSVSSPALVSANLESGGDAGEELVVKATITNSGTKSATYTLNAAGYSTWADSVSIDQSVFTLGAGDSKEVLFTFDVDEDASGAEQFNIEVISGNKLVTTQPVQVEIQETSSGFAGITGNVFADSNKYLWGIGILNVILIVFIIIVAIRVARR